MDIKQLGIEVTANGITQAANQLGKLVEKAAQVDPVLSVAKNALKNFSSVSLDTTITQVAQISATINTFNSTAKSISSSSAGFKNITTTISALATATDKLAATSPGLTTYQAALDNVKSTLQEMRGLSGNIKVTNVSTSGFSQTTINRSAQINDNEAYTASQKRLIAQLEREALQVGKTRAEYLEARAAQMGLTDVAAPYISRLKEASVQAGHYTMSQKEMNNAMRMVAPQMTDIVTQLAGGQNPFLIMIQQGGQLRDIFHGFGNMFAAVGPMVLKFLVNPLTMLSGVLAGITYGFIAGGNEMEAFSKAMVLTNGYLGISNAQFSQMVDNIGAISGSKSKAAEALTAIANSGKIAGDNVQNIGQAVVDFSEATGLSIDKVVEKFSVLAQKPAENIIKLNEQYHFLTLSVYAQITALEKQGDTQAAAALALNELTKAAEDMSKKLVSNAGYVEKAWTSVEKLFSGLKNKILDIGRVDLNKDLADAEKIVAAYQKMNNSQFSSNLNFWVSQRDKIKAQIEAQNKEAETAKNAQKTQEAALTAYKSIYDLQEKGLTKEQQKAKAIKDYTDNLNKIRATNPKAGSEEAKALSSDAIARGYEAINKQFADKGGDKENTRLAQLQAELQSQQEDLALLQKYPETYNKITQNQKKLYETQQLINSGKLSADELSNKKQELDILSQIVATEKKKTDVKKSYDEVKKYRDLKTWIDASNASLDDQITYLKQSGASSDTRTEIEKKYAAAVLDTTNNALSPQAKLAAQMAADDLKALSAKEKLAKQTIQTNALIQQATKNEADYNREVSDLAESYKKEQSYIGMSSAERTKAQAIWQVEIERRKTVLDLQVKQRQFEKEGNTQAAAEIQHLIDLENQRAAGKTAVIKQQPTLQNKEGSSAIADAKAGFEDFYNSLETRQQLFQSAFSQSFSLMTDTIDTFVTTGKLDFKSFTADVLKMIAQIMVKLAVMNAIKAASSYSGYADGGTFGTTTSAYANGGVFNKFANGGTFTNSIVTHPTPFKFASGGSFQSGLMGEAGPEAVMPLATTSSGKLGVHVASSDSRGGDVFNFTYNASDGSQTTTSSSYDKDSQEFAQQLNNKFKAFIIEEKRPGGLLAA